MHLPDIPNEVQQEDVERALEYLGIPVHERLAEVRWTYGTIELTYLRTDEPGQGNILRGGEDRLSKVTTTVHVRPTKVAGQQPL